MLVVQLLGVGALTSHKVKGHGDCKWNDLARIRLGHTYDIHLLAEHRRDRPEVQRTYLNPDAVIVYYLIDAALATTPR